MRSFIAYIVAFANTFIIAPLLRRISPGLDGLIADFTKIDAKIDAFLDREATRRNKLFARRKALRAEIDTVLSQVMDSSEASERAGRIQRRIRDIVE